MKAQSTRPVFFAVISAFILSWIIFGASSSLAIDLMKLGSFFAIVGVLMLTYPQKQLINLGKIAVLFAMITSIASLLMI